MRKLISPENKTKIIELYQSGLGSDTIAKQFDIHPNSVLKLLKKEGVDRRPILRKKIQLSDEPKIVEMYQQGMSAPEIAEHFDVAHTMILRYLEKNGIDRRSAEECHRIYPIREDFFDAIDTQEKAYFLGFLYADGGNNIDANFVRVDLARKDKDILEKLVSLIYLEDPLQHIKDQDRKKIHKGEDVVYYTSYFDICSKYICHKLEELGCGAKKSLILNFPEWLVDPELQRHFIRGYYDGDGGVFLTDIKTRSASTKMVSTIEFCRSMSDIVMNGTGVQFGDPYNDVEGKNVYTIRLSGNRQIATFLNWLYKDATIFLNRKYNLYLQLLEKNKETDRLIIVGTQGYQKRYLQK
jgi:intein-encoded DNA endonuclease-like protein